MKVIQTDPPKTGRVLRFMGSTRVVKWHTGECKFYATRRFKKIDSFYLLTK